MTTRLRHTAAVDVCNKTNTKIWKFWAARAYFQDMEYREVELRRSVFHIPVRYQSVDYIGQGTFGQVLGAVDAATGDG